MTLCEKILLYLVDWKMSVFAFEKSFLERIEEIKIIELDENRPIREQWADFLETSIEPAGYSAIWKISRSHCEQFEIRFPCEVYGTVQNTDFSDLAAVFTVESVQDDNVSLPETCRVSLEDLYPTIEQENSALNVDLTADCLDRFRFFFHYIYMPWDDDTSFIGKQLLPRMELFFDLKNRKLSKGLSSHIRGMFAEAKYIQNMQENLENSFDESSEQIDISHGESKDKARKLLELHFKMIKIKHELDILINPEMRTIYEEMAFSVHTNDEKCIAEAKVFAVTKDGTLSEQIQIIEELKHKIPQDAKIHWQTIHNALSNAALKSEIFIPSGDHAINFLEYMSGDILLSGLTEIKIDQLDLEQADRYARICAADSGAMLFAVDGDLRMENLIIDCRKVKTGFVVKDGLLTIKNCVIYGSKESSVTEGFAISGSTKLLMENCVINDFATGISINESAKVTIRNSIIKNCNLGVQLLAEDSTLSIENSSILNCDEKGILKYSLPKDKLKGQTLDWNDKETAAK